MGLYPNIPAPLGHHGHALCSKLDVLDALDRAADLHESRADVQHQIGECTTIKSSSFPIQNLTLQNGVLSALPYFVMWLLSFVFSGFTDLIINREWVSITAGRKIANSIGKKELTQSPNNHLEFTADGIPF